MGLEDIDLAQCLNLAEIIIHAHKTSPGPRILSVGYVREDPRPGANPRGTLAKRIA